MFIIFDLSLTSIFANFTTHTAKHKCMQQSVHVNVILVSVMIGDIILIVLVLCLNVQQKCIIIRNSKLVQLVTNPVM
jgi:hypothetical protein